MRRSPAARAPVPPTSSCLRTRRGWPRCGRSAPGAGRRPQIVGERAHRPRGLAQDGLGVLPDLAPRDHLAGARPRLALELLLAAAPDRLVMVVTMIMVMVMVMVVPVVVLMLRGRHRGHP